MLKHARSLRGLLLLSGLILMVHTLVPHVHGVHFATPGQASILPVTSAQTGWLDVLAELVDTDMGEDHLENFSPEKAVDFLLLAPPAAPALAPAFFVERICFVPETAGRRTSFSRSPEPEVKEVYLRRIAPRGPPFVA